MLAMPLTIAIETRDRHTPAGRKVISDTLSKAMAERIREVILEITPDHRIVRIQFEEADESVTEYRFAEQKENSAIADQRFRFEVPRGVEVIEGEFGP